MTISMKEIIGDYQAFFSLQLGRLSDVGIDISGCELSHLAFRTLTFKEYLQTREKIEQHSFSNIERVWNGRPMSMLQLEEPLIVGEGIEIPMIELIPPVHQRHP